MSAYQWISQGESGITGKGKIQNTIYTVNANTFCCTLPKNNQYAMCYDLNGERLVVGSSYQGHG